MSIGGRVMGKFAFVGKFSPGVGRPGPRAGVGEFGESFEISFLKM